MIYGLIDPLQQIGVQHLPQEYLIKMVVSGRELLIYFPCSHFPSMAWDLNHDVRLNLYRIHTANADDRVNF